MSTDMASFAGWEETVNRPDFFAVPRTLVFHHASEGRQRGIGQTTGEAVVLDHATHIQVLNTKHIESANQVRSHFVEIVLAGVGNTSVDTGNLEGCAFPAVTPLLPASNDALGASEFPFHLVDVLGVGDTFSVRQGSQTRNTQVNANSRAGLGEALPDFIQIEGNKIAFGTILGYRDCGWATFEPSGPSDLEPTNFGDYQRLGVSIPRETGTSIFSGLLPDLLLERRVSSTLIEEVFVSGLKMPQSLLLGNTRDIIKPSVFRCLLEGRESGRRGIVVDSLAFFEAIRAEPKRPVVNEATTAEGLGKLRLLFSGGVEPECVLDFHKNIVHLLRVVVNNNLTGGGASSPCLKAGVSAPSV